MSWPADADGDVLRRLEFQGFDFAKLHLIDFNIDFERWPPSESALTLLRKIYPNTIVENADTDDAGYVCFQVRELVSYDFVVRTQVEVSQQMAQFGGVCSSWGVRGDEAVNG